MAEHYRGCLPRTTKVGDGTFRVVPDDYLIDRKDWEKYPQTLHQHVWHIINQGRQNSCCACMGVGGLMLCREKQGLDKVILSQAVPYHFGNGGHDGGMAIDTCLQMLLKYGTVPISVVDQYDWQRRNWPNNWEEIAENYKIFEAMDCPTYEHAVSMVLRGHPVMYGAKGHAVVRIGCSLFTPIPDLNSWDRSWGIDGLGTWATEDELKRGIERQYGAWALRYATDPPNDGDLDP